MVVLVGLESAVCGGGEVMSLGVVDLARAEISKCMHGVCSQSICFFGI